jgi:hypothetical protein
VGYRLYSPDAARRIRFIKRAQELGFSLREIRELLDLRTNPGASRAGIRKRVLAKIREIEQKIRDLEAIRKSLEQLTTACWGRGSLRDCPTIYRKAERESQSLEEGGVTWHSGKPKSTVVRTANAVAKSKSQKEPHRGKAAILLRAAAAERKW